MDDDERWLAAEREQAGTCPACGLTQAQPIVYGMPVYDAYDRMSDRVAFSGCCVPEVLHRWRCGACAHEWGERPAIGEPEIPDVT